MTCCMPASISATTSAVWVGLHVECVPVRWLRLHAGAWLGACSMPMQLGGRVQLLHGMHDILLGAAPKACCSPAPHHACLACHDTSELPCHAGSRPRWCCRCCSRCTRAPPGPSPARYTCCSSCCSSCPRTQPSPRQSTPCACPPCPGFASASWPTSPWVSPSCLLWTCYLYTSCKLQDTLQCCGCY